MKLASMVFIGLALWGAAGLLEAQGNSDFLENAPPTAPSPWLPGLIEKTLRFEAAGPECPQNKLTIESRYPQGFPNPEVDRAIEEAVTAEFNGLRQGSAEWDFCSRDNCDSLSCGEWPVEKTFTVYAPSAGYASVLFTESSYTGGAHGNEAFDVFNFDLKNGRPLELTDLFPRPDQALPKYWAYVYAEWCRARGVHFPPHAENFPNAEKCRPGSPPSPPEEYLKPDSLKDLGRLVFSPSGATILFGPYEAGSYADGDQALDLPKAALLKMGANPAIWGQ